MAWFLNSYHCNGCGATWDDEWSCACADDCPDCRRGDIEPVESENLTVVVRHPWMPDSKGSWRVLVSPPEAEDRPAYRAYRFEREADARACAQYWTNTLAEEAVRCLETTP